ncbi:hypothetical protein C8T65DRAFT_824920 [Cerioporus squamosus]|nr:hypothetical protein C8T65DRAFT_824920 [Cerioporus squamosus]
MYRGWLGTGCGMHVPIGSFYNPKHLGLVEPPEKIAKSEWVLVYGRSTACGLSAIQLAHLSRYKVVTTASSRNHELLKSFGEDVTIDYREPDLVSKIKQATGTLSSTAWT